MSIVLAHLDAGKKHVDDESPPLGELDDASLLEILPAEAHEALAILDESSSVAGSAIGEFDVASLLKISPSEALKALAELSRTNTVAQNAIGEFDVASLLEVKKALIKGNNGMTIFIDILNEQLVRYIISPNEEAVMQAAEVNKANANKSKPTLDSRVALINAINSDKAAASVFDLIRKLLESAKNNCENQEFNRENLFGVLPQANIVYSSAEATEIGLTIEFGDTIFTLDDVNRLIAAVGRIDYERIEQLFNNYRNKHTAEVQEATVIAIDINGVWDIIQQYNDNVNVNEKVGLRIFDINDQIGLENVVKNQNIDKVPPELLRLIDTADRPRIPQGPSVTRLRRILHDFDTKLENNEAWLIRMGIRPDTHGDAAEVEKSGGGGKMTVTQSGLNKMMNDETQRRLFIASLNKHGVNVDSNATAKDIANLIWELENADIYYALPSHAAIALALQLDDDLLTHGIVSPYYLRVSDAATKMIYTKAGPNPFMQLRAEALYLNRRSDLEELLKATNQHSAVDALDMLAEAYRTTMDEISARMASIDASEYERLYDQVQTLDVVCNTIELTKAKLQKTNPNISTTEFSHAMVREGAREFQSLQPAILIALNLPNSGDGLKMLLQNLGIHRSYWYVTSNGELKIHTSLIQALFSNDGDINQVDDSFSSEREGRKRKRSKSVEVDSKDEVDGGEDVTEDTSSLMAEAVAYLCNTDLNLVNEAREYVGFELLEGKGFDGAISRLETFILSVSNEQNEIVNEIVASTDIKTRTNPLRDQEIGNILLAINLALADESASAALAESSKDYINELGELVELMDFLKSSLSQEEYRALLDLDLAGLVKFVNRRNFSIGEQ